MALRKFGAICLGRDARDLGQDHVADAAARHTQTLETVGHKLVHQFRIPADAVDGIFESGAPLTGPKPGVSGDSSTRPGMPVQVKGIRNHEAGQVPSEMAIQTGVLPVNDSAHLSAEYQEIAGPEVPVHQPSLYSLATQAGVEGEEILDVFSRDRVIAESAA